MVYQLCVAPGVQRSLIGATLIQSVFERAAYGCRLFCCWCAQDLEANYFWESLAFVPIAFRAGSTGKKRVHIFWQRRINADDTTTPYWYPCQTNAGAIREDRLVFPIPPGTHWTEVQAVTLPKSQLPVVGGQLPVKKERRKASASSSLATDNSQPATISAGGLRFAAVADHVPATAKSGRVREPKPKVKASPERSRRIDPKLVTAARELRDRWMEQVNADGGGAAGALPPSRGKYDVRRTGAATVVRHALPSDAKALPQAA